MKEVEYFLWHELADHYIEMAKSSTYKNENIENIRYTLYTLGLGVLKLFSPFFPHITEELYQDYFKQFENDKSIHISSWPKEILIDQDAENTGELVKNYIAQVRSIKSKHGIALNAPLKSYATYSTSDKITKIKKSSSIIISTLNLPKEHRFIEGKPEIQEKITEIKPVYSNIGPLLKNESKKTIQWIKEHQSELTKKIEENGDIKWLDIPIVNTEKPETMLIEKGYIKIKKETQVKGKKDRSIIKFDDFYLELAGDVIK
jgi:valyl-tRNA synthetase